jgi:hypothetical protein
MFASKKKVKIQNKDHHQHQLVHFLALETKKNHHQLHYCSLGRRVSVGNNKEKPKRGAHAFLQVATNTHKMVDDL